MPMVGNKKFAYTDAGKRLAAKYADKMQSSVKATRPAGNVRPIVQGKPNTTLPSLFERRAKQRPQGIRRRYM